MTPKNVLLLITPSSPGRFKGISIFARSHGWHLTVADRLTHMLDGWTGDGALVTLRDDADTLRRVVDLRRRRIPVVDLSLTRPDVRLPRVANDNAALGRLAAAYLAGRRFRHTAWFSTNWSHQHELRFGGSAEGLALPPEEWAWTLAPERTKSDDWKALSHWLQSHIENAPKPLGLFTFDDADASRAESAALAAGLSVPDDVAILGAGDDEPLCESQIVPISSVRCDMSRNGYVGAAMLDRLMSGGRAPSKAMLISPRGVAERASTDTLAVPRGLVRDARDIYRAELAAPPSTEELAMRLGVSRPTLDRAFAAQFGLPPAKLLALMRLEEAKRLLRGSSLTVAEIARRTGYCNPAYLVNVFRDATGLSPKKWRNSGLF